LSQLEALFSYLFHIKNGKPLNPGESPRLTAQGPLPGEDLLDGDQPLIQPIR
jgi:hypothetical protein